MDEKSREFIMRMHQDPKYVEKFNEMIKARQSASQNPGTETTQAMFSSDDVLKELEKDNKKV